MCDGQTDRWMARQTRPKTIVTVWPLWAEATNNAIETDNVMSVDHEVQTTTLGNDATVQTTHPPPSISCEVQKTQNTDI